MKNNADYYKHAIRLLVLQKDWKEICVRIAQKHPKVFVDACPIETTDEFEAEVVRTYRIGGIIQAVKYVREVKGWTLVASKGFVDGLKEKHGL